LAALENVVLTLTLTLSGPVLAAGFSCAHSAHPGKQNGTLEELEEVVVTGARVKTKTKDLQEWLKLLVGKYTYDGYIDLCGKDNAEDQRPVTGRANCIAQSSTANVQCTVNVRWPETRGEHGDPVLGGVSSLVPAFVIYALENRYIPEENVARLALMFTQVDSKGVAEWAAGTLVGDTFISKESCVGIPGDCHKITRITAKPNSNEISMRIDVDIDNQRVLRQEFLLHREPNSRNGRQHTAP
jgi:hypothetical protein